MNFMSHDFNGRGHFGDPGVDRVIILKWTLHKEIWGMDWILLA
jgi:hypothetical protein